MRPTSLVSLALALVALGCRQVPATIEPTPAPAPAPVFVEQPTTPAEPEPAPTAAASIAEFESFLGLRWGDTREDVLARFGQPAFYDPGDGLDTLYYFVTEDTVPDDGPPGLGDDFLFVITINGEDDRVFNIQAAFGDYGARGIVDPKLRYLGANLDEVKAAFGEPARSHADFNSYDYVDHERGFGMEVEFVCYDFQDFRCSELWVTWYEEQ